MLQPDGINIDNPFRYAGQYYDKETGLYYLRARYYEPELMRFITEDSYKGDVKDPLSLNLYVYCQGNPVMYVDIDGHFGILATILICAVISGGVELAFQAIENKGFNNINWGKVGMMALGGAVTGGVASGMGAALKGVDLLPRLMAIGAVSSAAGGIVSGEIKSANDFVSIAFTGAFMGVIGVGTEKLGDNVNKILQTNYVNALKGNRNALRTLYKVSGLKRVSFEKFRLMLFDNFQKYLPKLAEMYNISIESAKSLVEEVIGENMENALQN